VQLGNSYGHWQFRPVFRSARMILVRSVVMEYKNKLSRLFGLAWLLLALVVTQKIDISI
jgi:hypothetical protein